MTTTQTILDFVNTLNDVQIDHPFKRFPKYIVFRHTQTRKWFGIMMSIDKQKLGINDSGFITIIDIKLQPELINSLKHTAGFRPAYHMNKTHWITILLDGTLSSQHIQDFITDSYHLTK